MSSVSFSNQNVAFFNVLRQRVNAYFKSNNIKHTGNIKLYSKTVILLTSLFFCYTVLVFFTPSSILLSLSICSIMGLLMAAIGFNVMHDGAHGSYSNNSTLNSVMTCSLNLLGGSSFIWKQKHNINHHSYTNIEGLDDDIDIKPFIRINTSQKKHWFHRFQHVYSFLLYGLTYLFWVFYNDFKKYFSGKLAEGTKMKKFKISEHMMFWGTKVTYVFTFLLIPGYFVGIVSTIVGYSVIVFVCGLVIAIVFQLAHIHEEAEFLTPELTDSIKIENDWAIHQINTTANFATANKAVSWFVGGLNFQVEHHLFPKISHIHYPAISKIVQSTCQEYNVEYKEFPSVFSAIRSHLLYLKKIAVA